MTNQPYNTQADHIVDMHEMVTDNTQELDEILAKHNGELGVTWEDPDVVTPDTKQAILRWVTDEVIGGAMSKPDTNQASELFKLCKEVYELTGWGRMDNGSPTDEYYAANPVSIRLNKPDVIKGWQIWRWEDFGESGRLHHSLGKGHAVPLYTSDYLLGKLPKDVMLRRTSESERKGKSWVDGEWLASNSYGQSAWADDGGNAPNLKELCSDTPLKALLKLTIALSEAGELNE